MIRKPWSPFKRSCYIGGMWAKCWWDRVCVAVAIIVLAGTAVEAALKLVAP